ncbi:peptide chain release factor N(5)-glutamine methyltransferase [Clostridium malenominatum]
MTKVKNTIGELLIKGFNILREENIPSYRLDCQLLLGKVINKDKLFIMLNRDLEISLKEVEEYFKLVNLRKNKMPVKYILGQCEFMNLDFLIKEGVLIPRPDTEILVEKVIEEVTKNKYETLCDLCCGSGIIGISLAKYKENTLVDCYDIEDIPLEVTYKNILLHNLHERVKVYRSDLLTYAINENKKYDVVVSNPPYISEEDMKELMEDVKNYEPHRALHGGEDGLDFYRKIVFQSRDILNSKGMIAFEIGYNQGKEVMSLLEEDGFEEIECIKDLAGLDRVVVGKKL